MTEWSGISGGEGALVPTPTVGEQLPLPEKELDPPYTPTHSGNKSDKSLRNGANHAICLCRT